MGGASSDSAIGSSAYGLSSSNYLDGISSSTINNVSKYSDISSLLASLSLEKYDRAFRNHEIDLNALKTLSEEDLKEIGVGALGARRKLLLAITGKKKL
jgi:SAM domain (Sterile alpha motif).